MKENHHFNIMRAHSEYWLDKDTSKPSSDVFNLELIRLSEIKRSITNFVTILTNRVIPVRYVRISSGLTDGETIYITSYLKTKQDCDVTVGLALHEGSHILLTNFDVLRKSFANIPSEIRDVGEKKGCTSIKILSLVKTVHNIVEDRYIDNFVCATAPGYRGYYKELYNRYFNDPEIDEVLINDVAFKIPSLKSYKFRLTNLTNPNTNLDALPNFRKISELINLKTISRLKTTKDRINVAFDVSKIILESIISLDDEPDKPKGIFPKKQKGSQTGEPDEMSELSELERAMGVQLTKEELRRILKAIKKQESFLRGEIEKTPLTAAQLAVMEIIEKNKIEIVPVAKTPTNVKGVDCIVVKKVTKELIFSDVFPLSNHFKDDDNDFVHKGISLGIRLGKKLQIRNESNTFKFIRKPTGRIDKKLLHELSYESDNIFYHTKTEQFNKDLVRISIDASGSMSGLKWNKAMTTVVAICKAASMTNNLNVIVDMRTTVCVNSDHPYIAIVYDSREDKFSKIVQLFPYLVPNGGTPEGLCFEAVIDKIADNQYNSYFINFSDGEPCMHYQSGEESVVYSGEIAADHTKKQFNIIKNKGYYTLSYFITNSESNGESVLFKRMYGNDASFINVTNMTDVAKTLNAMFLETKEGIF